jgi:hypothetical protein
MPNAFDILVQQQREYRKLSQEQEWWIKSSLLNEEELSRLMAWYMDQKRLGIVDKSGILRVLIAKQLPADIVLQYFDINKFDKHPSLLGKYLQNRFIEPCSKF